MDLERGIGVDKLQDRHPPIYLGTFMKCQKRNFAPISYPCKLVGVLFHTSTQIDACFSREYNSRING